MTLINVPKTALLMFLMVLCIFRTAGYGSSRRGPDGNSRADRYGATSAEDVPMRRRISQQIELLKGESVEQSVKMLSEVEMYYWPGWSSGAGAIVFPLPEQVGQEDIERIMSNRRFLKVFNELSHLSKERASSLVTEQINSMLPRYKKMFGTTWKRLLDGIKKAPPGMPRSAGPTLQTTNNPNHAPTLAGARLQLLALVLVAGNLELESARPAVLSVLQEALGQRDYLYKSPVLSRLAERLQLPDYLPESYKGIEADRYLMLTKAGLYNRQILATGIIGTSDKSTKAKSEESPGWKPKWESRRLTHYDSLVTPYDIRHGAEQGGVAVDYGDGVIQVKFHKPLDDSEFNSLLELASVQSDVSESSSEPTESQAAWDEKYSDPREFIKLNWISGIPYEKVRSLITVDKLSLMHEMLEDKKYAGHWHKIARLIGYVSNEPNSVSVLLRYFQRDDSWNWKSTERYAAGHAKRLSGKIDALQWIGKLGADESDAFLRRAVTEDGAMEVAKAWLADKLIPDSSTFKTMENTIVFIRGRAAMGLVFTRKQENVAIVKDLLTKEIAYCAENQKYTRLYNPLASAMAYNDYIEDHDLESLFNLFGSRERVKALRPYIRKYRWQKYMKKTD